MKNKVIVVYKSSTGFTKRYAQMIAARIKCAAVAYRSVTAKQLAEYDLVIFGSRAHAGRIDGYKKIREMYRKKKIRRLVLFVTGATPNAAKEIITEFWRQNLTQNEIRKIPHFYMQAGLCYEKMSLTDRLMMKVAAVMMKKKKIRMTVTKNLNGQFRGLMTFPLKSISDH